MTFERLFLLFLVVPPVLWMTVNSHRRGTYSGFLHKASGAAILLLAFCLPGFVLRESRAVLADALASLSETDLEQEHDSIWRAVPRATWTWTRGIWSSESTPISPGRHSCWSNMAKPNQAFSRVARDLVWVVNEARRLENGLL